MTGPPDLAIRTFHEADTTAVAELWRRVFPDAPAWNVPEEDIRRKQAVQPELFRVGLVGGALVATVMAGYEGHRGWVYYLAVDPTLRRRGFGRAMMADAEARLRAFGCPKLNLMVRGHNAEVVAFYERLGYAVEDRVCLSKRLT